jgi:hypothetical protein
MSLWVDPEGDMTPAYHHLSYILFRTDREDAMILGARCPEPEKFMVGRQLTEHLKLDEESLAYLYSAYDVEPMLVQTSKGVGILDKRFHLLAGLGIYWHIHGNPDSLARLINRGVLGEADCGSFRISRGIAEVGRRVRVEDTLCYERLLDAWQTVGMSSKEWIPCDGDGCIYGDDLTRLLERMAIFVGCRLHWDEDLRRVARIKCRRPDLLKACLLVLLTEARTYGEEGGVTCLVDTLGKEEGEGLTMSLRYPLVFSRKTEEHLDHIYRHLERVGDLSGLYLRASRIPLKYGEGKLGKLPQRQIRLDWIRDPAVLASSDLKAENQLKE